MKHIHRTFVRQLDQTDCGVACLLSVIRFYGGDVSRERLREQSGTSIEGTTLMGLLQSASALGFETEAWECEGLHNLAELTEPVILHVVIDQRLQHYAVFYPTASKTLENLFVIGDPARGVVTMTADELATIWQSKALMTLTPTDRFVRTAEARKTQWQWFKSIIHDDVSLLTAAAGLGVVVAVLGLSMALFSQRLIDEILPKQDTRKLLIGLFALTLLLAFRAGISYLRNLLLLRQSKAFNSRITGSFFNDLLRLPKAFFDNRKTGDLIARLNDTRRIQSVISYLTGNVVIDTLVILITAAFLFSYSWPVGIVALGSMPLFAWLVWHFNKPIITGQRDVMAAYARTESHFIDAISGVGVIKANRKESFFGRMTLAVYESFQGKVYDLGALGNRYALWSELGSVGLLVMLVAVTGWLVLTKQLRLGEMMAVISMANTLISSVAKLSTTNIQLQEARVAFARMREFTEIDKENTSAVQDTSLPGALAALRVEGVSFRFPGRKSLLKDVSFTARRGEIVGIIGETGSGKSMLLQLLMRFYTSEKGTIMVDFQRDGIGFAGGGVKWQLQTSNWTNGGAGLRRFRKL